MWSYSRCHVLKSWIITLPSQETVNTKTIAYKQLPAKSWSVWVWLSRQQTTEISYVISPAITWQDERYGQWWSWSARLQVDCPFTHPSLLCHYQRKHLMFQSLLSCTIPVFKGIVQLSTCNEEVRLTVSYRINDLLYNDILLLIYCQCRAIDCQ